MLSLCLKAVCKRELDSFVQKHDLNLEMETKKVRTLALALAFILILIPTLTYTIMKSDQVKRREACLQFQISEQNSNLKDLEFALKHQSSEHIVAQHETKKFVRWTQNLTLTHTLGVTQICPCLGNNRWQVNWQRLKRNKLCMT